MTINNYRLIFKPFVYLFLRKTLIISLLSFSLFIPKQAVTQVPGSTSTTNTNLTFQKNFNNLTLDPSPLTGSGSRKEFVQTFGNTNSPTLSGGFSAVKNVLEDNGIDIPDWLSNLIGGTSFFCSEIKPKYSASVSVQAGGYYQTHSVGTSNIGINYPVEVTVVYPQKNTFACGDEIEISTSYTVPLTTNRLSVTPPFVNQEIGLILRNLSLSASVGLDAEVGFGVEVAGISVCSDKLYFDKSKSFSITPRIPTLPPLVNFCENAFGPGANEASLFSCAWSGASPVLKLSQQALDMYNEQKNKNYHLATFPTENKVVLATPNLPPDAPTLPEFQGTFQNVKNTGLSYSTTNAGKDLKASGTKNSISEMSIDLVSLLDYYPSITTSTSLGDNVGDIDLGDVSPTFTVNQSMDFSFKPVIHLSIDLGMTMNYTVYNSDGTSDFSSTGKTVNLIAGQSIRAKFPQNCSSPVNASGTSNITGTFSSSIVQEYFRSIQVNIGEINIPGFITETLVSETLAKTSIGSKTIVDHDITLNLGSKTLNSFTLDPENPKISIDNVSVEDVVNLGDGEKAIVYKIDVSNQGDVKLNNVELDFDLAKTFITASSYSIECLHSAEFALDNEFNGDTFKNLLQSGNSLEVGGSANIEVLVKVKPEKSQVSAGGCFGTVNYNANAKAYAVSPIGTIVENNYNQCTESTTGNDIVAAVDLGASIISGIEDFTLYGWNMVKMDKAQEVSMGNVGSSKDVIFENSSLKNTNPATIFGDIHVGGQLFIQGESKVEADYIAVAENVKTPNWKSLLTLNGALAERSKCVAVQPIINNQFPKVTSKNNIILKDKESKLIPPGQYNSIVLTEGSEVIFSSGEYHIGRWAFLGDGATVKFKTAGGQVILNLETWQALGRNNLQLIIDGDGSVDDIVYNYSGKQKCTFNSSFIQGRIIAPNAEIEFASNTKLEGVCYANKVNFKTGSSFVGSKFLKKLNINPDCQDALIPEIKSELKSGSIDLSNKGNKSDFIFENKYYLLKVYPNPTHDYFNIAGLPKNNKIDIRIYNSMGQLVKLVKNDMEIVTIDMKNQPSGIFYININGIRLKPVIKN